MLRDWLSMRVLIPSLTEAYILLISLKVFPLLLIADLDRLRLLSDSPSYTSIVAETVEDDEEEEELPSSFWEQDEVKTKVLITKSIKDEIIFVFIEFPLDYLKYIQNYCFKIPEFDLNKINAKF